MIKKLISQNRVFLLITLALFLIFSSVLYVSMNQIYEREARLQHELEEARLLAAERGISSFLADSGRDLRFISSLPAVKNYIESGFAPSVFGEELRQTFYSFARAHKKYYGIRLMDFSGREVAAVYNRPGEAAAILSGQELRDRSGREYFKETKKLEKHQIYVSPVGLTSVHEGHGSHYLALVRMGAPLFKGDGQRAGVLILDVNLAEWLNRLPGEIFVQTEEGNLISAGPAGTVESHESVHVFTQPSGMLVVSDIETIHYSAVEVLSGRTLFLAIQHEHPLLQLMFHRLILATVILLVLFLGLIFVIDYVNISRGRELIKAEQAIIFSLAGLAEGRDPETGAHLERTGKYLAVLAKQLAKKPEFRKVITSGFIDNLRDAAPLHDIGKVGMKDSILLKEGKLTEDEFKRMKQHVSVGAEVIRKTIKEFKLTRPFLEISLNICAYHHEKYNGQGYPGGLKDGEIPLEARMFALCDAYDTIRSKRPYKGALTHEEAVSRIKSDSGKHFDPDIVEAFLECEENFAAVSGDFPD